MAEITNESYAKFNEKFPDSMTLHEIAIIVDQMPPAEAQQYDAVLCSELFLAFCSNYIIYDRKTIEIIKGMEEYKIFKRHCQSSSFYHAYAAFVEGRRNDVRKYIHEYMQTFVDAPPPFGEAEVASVLLLAFKNAYDGFWPFVKKEISAIPHDDITTELCDVIEAFYHAESNEDALQVLAKAYQRYPESATVNELLGVVYYDMKQYGNAIAAFERLYRDDTGDYNAMLHTQDQINFLLGYANDKMKDRKAAIKHYEKTVEIYPAYPSAANNLGYAYYRERQYDKAYAILKRCLDENLEESTSYPASNFARVLYAMGRYQEAKEFVKTAPAKIPKNIRDKIEKAPSKDAVKTAPAEIIDDSEEQSEPVVRAVIERKEVQFQSEKVLEDELTMRMESGMSVFGLPLKIYRRRGEYGRQYIFPKGRLDILAEDADGNLYIIELKKDSGYDNAYQQLVEYIEWFQKHKARGKKVYGIICLNNPGRTLIETVRQDDRVRLFEYRISYDEIS